MRALCLLLLLAAAPAAASPGELGTVEMPAQSPAAAATVLYLNRCKGGCTLTAGADDARTLTSSIPQGGSTFTMTEWAWGDTEWNAFMQCMREVYSPYAVTVTDVLPVGGIAYNEGVVAGRPTEIGISPNFGGIAPVTSDCSPYSNVISFSFANTYGPTDRPYAICWTAAQETAHAYGLDHEYAFTDGRSACNDPMTYRSDCGGEKFFRNDAAMCGEFTARPCRCGANQNSHLHLTSVLGAATPITTPPKVTLTSPAAGSTIQNGSSVIVTASAQRGVRTLELSLNGYVWAKTTGAAFGAEGQPESSYPLALPADVPDGLIDIVVTAKDDLGIATATAPITVTKGAPCTTADTCANGQRCDAGHCLWDPPAGEVGDDCTFDQFCKTGLCASANTGQMKCSQSCIINVGDSCPMGFDCLGEGVNTGVCWPHQAGGGCCDSSGGSGAALLALGLAFVIGKRRR